MTDMPAKIDPEHWLRALLASREAQGGVFTRYVSDVERLVGREAFLREVERRGWQALENGRHFLICCNAEPVRRVRTEDASARPDASQGRAAASATS